MGARDHGVNVIALPFLASVEFTPILDIEPKNHDNGQHRRRVWSRWRCSGCVPCGPDGFADGTVDISPFSEGCSPRATAGEQPEQLGTIQASTGLILCVVVAGIDLDMAAGSIKLSLTNQV